MKRAALSIILVVSLLSFVTLTAVGKKVSTKLSAPTTTVKEKTRRMKHHTSDKTERAKIEGKIKFMGYDKKAGASKETFFIENSSDLNLTGLDLEISYYNKAGKLIHKRKVEVTQSIPSKETRMVDIPSWDTQKSYHYINSTPSSKGSTPYSVRFKVLTFSTDS